MSAAQRRLLLFIISYKYRHQAIVGLNIGKLDNSRPTLGVNITVTLGPITAK